jgi:hypothetical protein
VQVVDAIFQSVHHFEDHVMNLYKKDGIEISTKNGNADIIDISVANSDSEGFAYLTLWVDPEWTKIKSFDMKVSHMTLGEISKKLEPIITFVTISTPNREFNFKGSTISALLKTIH